MDGFTQKPYNPPGVLGDEASMLEHVFQCHGIRLSPGIAWPQHPGPMRHVQWKPIAFKLWQKTPRSRVAQTHKSYGD